MRNTPMLQRMLQVAALLSAWPLGSTAQPTSIPDFAGIWGRNWFFLEPPFSGVGPVGSKRKLPDGREDIQGASFVVIGDDANPILTPRAAEALRRRAAISRNGAAPDPHNQCLPEPTPYTLALSSAIQIIQQKDEVVIIQVPDQKVRHIKMNVPHPAHVVPTWQGDSVGHYEGDTLVIDTIGQKAGPLSVIDPYGTPFSEKLHVIERYRLIDGVAARDAQVKNDARYFPAGVASFLTNEYGRGSIDPDTNKPGLQVEITVEDPVMFTTPWSALVTWRHVPGEWPEAICAENTREYYANRNTGIPTADKPDF